MKQSSLFKLLISTSITLRYIVYTEIFYTMIYSITLGRKNEPGGQILPRQTAGCGVGELAPAMIP